MNLTSLSKWAEKNRDLFFDLVRIYLGIGAERGPN